MKFQDFFVDSRFIRICDELVIYFKQAFASEISSNNHSSMYFLDWIQNYLNIYAFSPLFFLGIAINNIIPKSEIIELKAWACEFWGRAWITGIWKSHAIFSRASNGKESRNSLLGRLHKSIEDTIIQFFAF